MDLTWKKHEPQASPFAIVAGDPTQYVVYTLSVPSADEADIRAAITESVAQMCRLADANVTERTEIVLFEWDSVSSVLTVVYTNRERDFDAREVLKVLLEGWEAERSTWTRMTSCESGGKERARPGLGSPSAQGSGGADEPRRRYAPVQSSAGRGPGGELGRRLGNSCKLLHPYTP